MVTVLGSLPLLDAAMEWGGVHRCQDGWAGRTQARTDLTGPGAGLEPGSWTEEVEALSGSLQKGSYPFKTPLEH